MLFAAYCKFLDKDRRHSTGYWGRLTFATGPGSVVNQAVIAHCDNVAQCLRTVSYDIDIIHRLCEPSVFYKIAPPDEEGKVSLSDFDLPIAEFIDINAFPDRGNDAFRVRIPALHICGAHPRNRG